ncbi:MAG: nicotinate-nucleotide adenylyltransferase [Candidatus Omnitrophota bacterium]
MGKSVSKRIGILGGTFNPVHNAHLHIAGHALKKLRLDKVIFVPAFIPPHKKIAPGVTTEDRLRMLGLALAGKKFFEVSQYEVNKKGASYSVRTAGHLRKKYGKTTKLFFLIGADSLRGLSKWKKIGTLRKIVRFAVAPRPGFKIKKRLPGIIMLSVPKRNISSTGIRRLVREKKPIKHLVPPRIGKYIRERKLYR